MAGNVKPIPDGYHAVTPYLIVNDGARALEFYQRAFGAKERMRMRQPDGRIGHAEVQIGDSRIMLADEFPEMDARSPKSIGGSPVSIMLYVEDVDAVFQQAIAAGARGVRPVADPSRLLGTFWPEDETADDFLAAVRAWRDEDERGAPRE